MQGLTYGSQSYDAYGSSASASAYAPGTYQNALQQVQSEQTHVTVLFSAQQDLGLQNLLYMLRVLTLA